MLGVRRVCQHFDAQYEAPVRERDRLDGCDGRGIATHGFGFCGGEDDTLLIPAPLRKSPTPALRCIARFLALRKEPRQYRQSRLNWRGG